MRRLGSSKPSDLPSGSAKPCGSDIGCRILRAIENLLLKVRVAGATQDCKAGAWLTAVMIVLGLLTAPTSAKGGTLFPAADHLVLHRLLKEGRFEDLENRLSGIQRQFEVGQIPDYAVQHAFYAFATTDPRIVERLDEWARISPHSFVPFTARGVQRAFLASVAASSYPFESISDESRKAMDRRLDEAGADAVRAIEQNPLVTPAYRLLLIIAQYRKNRGLTRAIVEEALKAAPHSVYIRLAYLSSLLPWWGGYPEEMTDFLQESKPYLETDSGSHELEGYPHFARGLTLSNRGRFQDSLEHYVRALAFGEMASYRAAKARSLYQLNQGQAALEEIDRALAITPYARSDMATRARILTFLGRFDEAFAVWETILTLDPLNPEYLLSRARFYRQAGSYEKAKVDLDAAMLYGAQDHEVRFERGRLNLLDLDNRLQARADFKIAMALAPRNSEYQYYYAEALTQGPNSQSPECEAVDAFEKYLELCRKSHYCAQSHVVVAEYMTTDRPEIYGHC